MHCVPHRRLRQRCANAVTDLRYMALARSARLLIAMSELTTRRSAATIRALEYWRARGEKSTSQDRHRR